MKRNRLEQQIISITALNDAVRRALYFQVRKQGEVSRDQAAKALRISRALAAFHLDKLVEAGLLEATFRRLSNRRGPGAGRPSKLYRRSGQEIEISLPERRYELAGQLMATAIADVNSREAIDRLQGSAREWGERLGVEARPRASSAGASGHALKTAINLLREAGFDPRMDESTKVVLMNCPFDALAREHREVVCGMNRALIEGVVTGLGFQDISAKLDPAPGRCCVTILSKKER